MRFEDPSLRRRRIAAVPIIFAYTAVLPVIDAIPVPSSLLPVVGTADNKDTVLLRPQAPHLMPRILLPPPIREMQSRRTKRPQPFGY